MKMKMTPKMTIDSLRLLKKNQWIFEEDDDEDTKEQAQGVASLYLAAKAAGKTDLEFQEWYETSDVNDLDEDDGDGEGKAEADPTA
jgi:hypothetical protein